MPFPPHPHDDLAEWLRRWPAKPLGYAREGSNPSVVAIFTQRNGPVAQWIARLTSNQAVGGSSPSGIAYFCLALCGTPGLGRVGLGRQLSAIGLVVKYLVANEVPRVRFPDGAYLAPVAQLVAPRSYVPMVQGSSPCRSIFSSCVSLCRCSTGFNLEVTY